MGAKIRYTHDGDLFRQLGVWIGSMILVALLGTMLDPISRQLETALVSRGLEWLWLAVMWTFIIGAYIFFVKFLTKLVLPPWKTTLKYVQSFGVTLSKLEAEKVSFLTDGSLGDKWYPLDWLKDVETNDKRRRLFGFANEIADRHGINRPFEQESI